MNYYTCMAVFVIGMFGLFAFQDWNNSQVKIEKLKACAAIAAANSSASAPHATVECKF